MVNQGRFIAYYRVSTARQGKSGLGLEAQRQAVAAYLGSNGWRILKEFVEVESGKRADRPELDAALKACQQRQVPLVVAKVDRLTRSLSFLMKLLEAGVDVRFTDLPQIEGATGRFLLQQMASVAELEAGMISKRTKDALAAAKARGVKLGGLRGKPLTAKQRAMGRAAIQERVLGRAAILADAVQEAQASGAISLRAIAAKLDAQNITTPQGCAWTAASVGRLLKQLAKIRKRSGAGAP